MVIGITGGIGSGKSTVSKYLEENGYKVIDADKVAREIVEKGSVTLRKLAETFGKDILEEDGSLNRKRLGEKAFCSIDNKKVLDTITHGEICKIIKNRIKQNEGEITFVDGALLFETNLDRDLDKIWVVTAEEEERIKRVIKRDNITLENVKSRIALQMQEKDKCKRADEVISNSGNKEELYQEIDRLLAKYV